MPENQRDNRVQVGLKRDWAIGDTERRRQAA
jgi:hypothetical protein